ncbi:MAG TPA: glycosyltransferase [Thermoleophilaceae bacterium]|nr:glycosyltransferase [Thermoleophilaceae bacterium]
MTVVIPTRDRWDVVPRTVASALAQESVEVEAVVVDDGSAQPAGEDAFGGDPRVTIVRHARPLGVSHARNAGIRAAAGPWVALLDDDDLWSPLKLKEQLEEAERTGADWVYSAVVLVDAALRPLEHLAAPDPPALPDLLISEPTSAIPAGASNVCVRTDTIRATGGFDEHLFHLADWDLWIRLAAEGLPAACQESHVAYVRHPGSMLVKVPDLLTREADYLFDKHAGEAAARGLSFDRLRFERWIASGHRRAGRRRQAARVYLRGAVRHRSAGNLFRALGALLGETTWGRVARRRHTDPLERPRWLESFAEVP